MILLSSLKCAEELLSDIITNSKGRVCSKTVCSNIFKYFGRSRVEIISVVLHERAVFGNSEEAEIYAEELDHMIEAGEIDLDMYFDAESVTTSEIASIIENTH